MRYDQQHRRFRASATDLANHARCEHLTHRARAHAMAVAAGTAEPFVRTGLAVEKGRAFETAHVQARRIAVEAAGGRFVDCAAAGDDPRERRNALHAAMRDGVELIAQAPMRSGGLSGVADLLVRASDAAPAGTLMTPHRYEPVEIKYGRSVRPEYALQASAYADALEQLQGDLPTRMRVVTGDEHEHVLRTADYIEYYRAARDRLLAALDSDLAAALEPVPDPVAHCDGCDFAVTCRDRRTAVDHLSLVANIRTDQRRKLEAIGVHTVEQLAATLLDRVPTIGDSTFERLVTQARLQVASRDRDPADTAIEFRRPGPDEPPGRGFAMLPPPDREDLFFDFEGYPYHERGALEYLWGWTSHGPAGTLRFDHLWADTPEQEAVAFTRFLDEVDARRSRSDGRMHVYHYAPYEVTALGRLAKEHPHEQGRLDALLRAGVFVDLFAVVRQALLVGRPSYSIKQLEPLYGVSRAGDELADGGASIEVYERWLNERDEAIRDTILDYNRVDCESTFALRDWLVERREEAAAAGIVWPTPIPPTEPDAEQQPDRGTDEDDDADPGPTVRARLEAIAVDPEAKDDIRLAARLLAAMPGWNRRVKREFFGDLYARMHDRHPEDGLTDPNVLSMLKLVAEDRAPARAVAGTVDRTYRYPDQVHMVEVGHDAIDPSRVVTAGTVRSVDHDACELTIRTTTGQANALAAKGVPPGWTPQMVIGWADIPTLQLERVARDVGARFADSAETGVDPFAMDAPTAATCSLLARHATRVTSGPGPEAISGVPDIAELADLVWRAEGSHVIVQGPPGTGKTHTSARLIAELVERGARVGISSNSHDAAINVLRGIDRYRTERAGDGRPLALRAAYALRKRSGERSPGSFGFGADWIERPDSTRDAARLLAEGDVQVVAGTAWQLAACDELDVVLVDEAGQVSLLHLTAMTASARRVVLVGDPQQLPQPASASHPHGCGASALEHLFEGAAVLARERAVLLPTTWRMHPAITSFVSTAYYRGELHSAVGTADHRAWSPHARELPPAGTHLVEVPHVGRRSHAPEEVDAIADLVARLLDGGRVVARAGAAQRALRPSDLIVVAPYNAQRRALQQVLDADVPIGTVDKFQGQEAAVAIVSMTASSRDDLPRGLEFLLDPHRLNVAISRARALTVLVASPALLDTDATSLGEMTMLNDLARYAHTSSRSRIVQPLRVGE